VNCFTSRDLLGHDADPVALSALIEALPFGRLLGNVSNPEDADALPNRTITLAFSRRGPNLSGAFLPKLTPDAVLVQELVSEQDGAGLKEIFGRKPFMPRSHGDADHLIDSYGGLEMLPVSAKS
jgi:hypothetical protein